MKLEELETFRNEREKLLTPELGPEKAREDAQAAYEARLANLDEEIREQLRADIANARDKRAGTSRRYGRDVDDVEDGGVGVSREIFAQIYILKVCDLTPATTCSRTRG